jgi:hypothetical protein
MPRKQLLEVQVKYSPCGEPMAGGGGGGTYCGDELTVGEDICAPPPSPIVFDLGDRGYDLTSVDEGVQFDIDADGALEQVAWIARGSGLRVDRCCGYS